MRFFTIAVILIVMILCVGSVSAVKPNAFYWKFNTVTGLSGNSVETLDIYNADGGITTLIPVITGWNKNGAHLKCYKFT
jgi:hypothetical protein